MPVKLLGELNDRLTRPLKLNLKRPLLRSHPYLQALNLLLRASCLGRVEGVGEKARLVVDPAMRMQWNQQKKKTARILERHGKAPRQYSNDWH